MPGKYTTSEDRGNKLTSISAWHDFARNKFAFLLLAGIIGFGIIAYFGAGPGGGGTGSDRSAIEGRANEPVVLVNGEPIKRGELENSFQQFASFSRGDELQTARFKGMAINSAIDEAIKRAAAKKQGLSVSDADIDKAIDGMKKSLGQGKDLTDDQFEARLQELGLSTDGLRENLRERLLSDVLFKSIAAKEKVSEQDLLNNYTEVKVRHILIDNKKQPDAQAKAKAEKILAEAKAGKDFAQLANTYTDDPGNQKPVTDPKTQMPVIDPKTKKPKVELQGGLYDWAPSSKYVPEFAAASRSLKVGEISGLVKTDFGYHIMKGEGTRQNLPKDFAKDKPKLLEDLKMQKAAKPQQEFMDNARKTAKIEWKDNSYKWLYDFNSIGQPNAMNPAATDSSKAEDTFIAELRDYVSKEKDDSAANLVLAQTLGDRLARTAIPLPNSPTKNMTPEEKDKLRNEVIGYYLAALKRTENQQARFRLAELYMDSKQNDKALEQYTLIKRYMTGDEGPQTQSAHTQLQQGFTRLGRKDLADEETKELAAIAAQQEKERKAQAEAEAKAKAEAAKKTPTPPGPATGSTSSTPPQTLVVPPAGKK